MLDPVPIASGRAHSFRKGGMTMAKDPVCQMDVEPKHAAAQSQYQGQTYYFCAVGCKTRFDADPRKYLGK
jgi:YHS domain-containing protein